MPIVGQFGSLAALGSLILPGGAMESIATVTVGSGGAADVTFSSIPSGFQHLQIRFIARSLRSSAIENAYIQINGDTGNTYADHILYGDGSSAGAIAGSSRANLRFQYGSGDTASANVFGGSVIDILDYASTSKNKTLRSFTGYDTNTEGFLGVSSGLWASTSAITSIKIYGSIGNWKQHSTFALYGIKAP